ncbi:hydrolase [Mycobacterium gordonae]|uniref:Hydrolase n=1 Tax=Mycobacterium gordonae TaxID=1778 RepID=A0A0Q2RSV2_MYCGO|nr:MULTISPECIES: amidohydrolase family protein [Mycobacterium]KQH78363.1 hydrolase [Mycobacterium gordonae]MDP7730287.1 amidohydrolase family protein [Mycobacterium sp. TY813]
MTTDALRISNVNIFDSIEGRITGPQDVTLRDNLIESITPPDGDDIGPKIDGTGKTLMPGLIDAHWHAMFTTISALVAQVSELGYVFARAVVSAEETLLRGFTTVRDLGGPVFGIKQAIDDGTILGPRIYPAGGFISQTGGHGDFRMPHEVPRGICGHLSYIEIIGAAVIADGEAEVLRGAREMLRRGASQLKLMAGGGVASAYDPLDVAQFTEAEMRAAVEAAENWGTYVTVHAYTPRAIRTAVAAGVRCVEHGHLIDDQTAALLAEKDVWWCLQPFLDDEDAVTVPPGNVPKFQQMVTGTDTAYELAIKHNVKIAFGTDTLFDAALAKRQGAQLAKLTRWFTPAEVLQQATVRNAELLAMSGPRNPYPGRLGVVAEGALADLILVDGDPVADISLIARPDEAFTAIIKDGRLVKGAVS